MLILTGPPPQPAEGLADAGAPAYLQSSGFTPDGAKVVTVLSIQLALEQYRSGHGSYPATLGALFPMDAPLGPDGGSMTAAPTADEGFAYSVAPPLAYTLSVRLASGGTYVVHQPLAP